jgi:hypothetical protein
MQIIPGGRQGNFANLTYQIGIKPERRFLDFYRLSLILRAVNIEHIEEGSDERLDGNYQSGGRSLCDSA